MRFRRTTSSIRSMIDLTPLIDTVFNLLLFFMLSSTYVVLPGMSVRLPPADKTEPQRQKAGLVVTLTKDERIFFAFREVTLEELSGMLKKAITLNPGLERMLIIDADAHVTHGKVVEVMDAARRAEIGKIAIATRPPNKGL